MVRCPPREEEQAITPRVPLYHYSGWAALSGILKTGGLWCFCHRHQKDKAEFDFALGLARRITQRVLTQASPVAHNYCMCLLDLLTKEDFNDHFAFFLFSLSRLRNSKSHWIEYGRDNGCPGAGFAIGFAPHLFTPDRVTLAPRRPKMSMWARWPTAGGKQRGAWVRSSARPSKSLPMPARKMRRSLRFPGRYA